MKRSEGIKRYGLFIIGLLFISIAINLTITAKLGTDAVALIPYVLSLALPVSMGTLVFSLNMIFIMVQVILLRKRFEIRQLIQIPLVVIFGFFIDMTGFFIRSIDIHLYWVQMAVLLLACLTMAFGITLTTVANIILNAGEAIVNAIAIVTKKEFGSVKVMFDVSLVIIGTILSLIIFGSVKGVREGTVIEAILVGFLIKIMRKHLLWIDKKFLMSKDDKTV